MADKSVQVTLSTSFQKLTALVTAKRVADGLPPIPAWHFREIRVQAAKDAAGTISFQKGTSSGTNPFLEIEAGEAQPFTSGERLNLNSLEGIWAKSSVNLDKLNLLLQE